MKYPELKCLRINSFKRVNKATHGPLSSCFFSSVSWCSALGKQKLRTEDKDKFNMKEHQMFSEWVPWSNYEGKTSLRMSLVISGAGNLKLLLRAIGRNSGHPL